MNLEKITRQNVKELKPYSSARDEFEGFEGVFLDANENPYDNGVNRYPDPYQTKLKQVVSELKGLEPNQILLGNGSDEVLDLLFRAFCEPKQDQVVFTAPSYGMYKVLANTNNVDYHEVFYQSDFTLNVEEVIAAIDEKTKLLILCSPNNPTGQMIPENELEQILKASNCLVVLDEAYINFSKKESWIKRLKYYPQLVVIQTLSKYYGMAGLRLGMCFASPEIVTVLNKIKPPYNINTLTQKKAIELLANIDTNYQKEVMQEKNKLESELSKLSFVNKVYPSDTNFLLVKVNDANQIYDQLLKQGIIIRNRSKEPLCDNCLRISIGTKEENQILINTLKQL